MAAALRMYGDSLSLLKTQQGFNSSRRKQGLFMASAVPAEQKIEGSPKQVTDHRERRQNRGEREREKTKREGREKLRERREDERQRGLRRS
ncbi:uncharacterized protein A4U43_C08F35300 [Asparagus officinalis]|nr:uncharacterized protein A4U43_C08F35300 [Asparagus officinalis]